MALLAYELAFTYHTDPDVFLDKPVTAILGHIIGTRDMLEARKRARRDAS